MASVSPATYASWAAGGVQELRVARQPELDPVGDLQAGLAAGVLHGVDDLAREPLATQLVVELQGQGDRVARLGLDLVAVERLHRERQVVGVERVLAARRR